MTGRVTAQEIPNELDRPRMCEGHNEICISLLGLDDHLVGRLWPDERVVAGLASCKRIRELLRSLAESVVARVKWCDPSRRPFIAKQHAGMLALFQRQDFRAKLFANRRCPMLIEILLYGQIHFNTCKNLSQLSLTYCRMGRNGTSVHVSLEQVLIQCTNLVRLDLKGNQLRDRAIPVVDALRGCPRLTSLDLSWNMMEDAGVTALADSLTNCSSLTHLGLGGNDFQNGTTVGAILATSPSMTHLDLGRNRLNDHEIRKVAEGLRRSTCKGISHLILRANPVGATGMRELMGALEGCENMTHLDFRCLGICDRAAEFIAAAVGNYRRLKHLDLSKNWPLGHEGILAILNGLQECKELETLDLRFTQMTRETAYKAHCFDVGRAGQLNVLFGQYEMQQVKRVRSLL
mmetsp:Transcript_56437/g.115486  ORF Transcript_56437/g.115486 Transcript_56437/m.115486 type:complete len:405 (-) Transcript_56437:7-1221(-)